MSRGAPILVVAVGLVRALEVVARRFPLSPSGLRERFRRGAPLRPTCQKRFPAQFPCFTRAPWSGTLRRRGNVSISRPATPANHEGRRGRGQRGARDGLPRGER